MTHSVLHLPPHLFIHSQKNLGLRGSAESVLISSSSSTFYVNLKNCRKCKIKNTFIVSTHAESFGFICRRWQHSRHLNTKKDITLLLPKQGPGVPWLIHLRLYLRNFNYFHWTSSLLPDKSYQRRRGWRVRWPRPLWCRTWLGCGEPARPCPPR